LENLKKEMKINNANMSKMSAHSKYVAIFFKTRVKIDLDAPIMQ